jgi:hypothetical protein
MANADHSSGPDRDRCINEQTAFQPEEPSAGEF